MPFFIVACRLIANCVRIYRSLSHRQREHIINNSSYQGILAIVSGVIRLYHFDAEWVLFFFQYPYRKKYIHIFEANHLGCDIDIQYKINSFFIWSKHTVNEKGDIIVLFEFGFGPGYAILLCLCPLPITVIRYFTTSGVWLLNVEMHRFSMWKLNFWFGFGWFCRIICKMISFGWLIIRFPTRFSI